MQTDSIRFVLKNDFSFGYNNNNGLYIYQVSNSLSTQVKSKDLRKIYFLIGDYSLIKSEIENYNNNWLLHLRFNFKITNLWRFETFIQSQSNKLLDVKSRTLIGAGIRLKVISSPYTKLYIANSYMYEEEKSDAMNQKFINHRNNSYLSFTKVFPESKISIINTIYFQPLYDNFDDFRIMEQLKIEVPFTKKIIFNTLFNYFYDNVTPNQRKQYTSNIKVGIGLEI